MYAQERIDDILDNFVLRTNVRALMTKKKVKMSNKKSKYRVKMYAYDI